MDVQDSCRVLLPEEKKSRRICVLSSMVAARWEFGHGLWNFAPFVQESVL